MITLSNMQRAAVNQQEFTYSDNFGEPKRNNSSAAMATYNRNRTAQIIINLKLLK